MIEKPKKLFKSYKELIYTAETGIAPIDWLSEFIYNKYRSIIAKYEAIKRSIFWAIKMHKSYDFDGHTIYEMLYYKLDRMEKCMSKYGHCVWNSCPEEPEYELMIKLRRARDLAWNLFMINPHERLPELQEAHDKKWGSLETNIRKMLESDKTPEGNYIYRSWRKNVNSDDEKAQEKKEQRIIWKKQNEAHLDDMIELFELLKYNTELWWD